MPGPFAKLVVVGGEREGTTLEVSRPVQIGSHRDSDLHLRDAAVSWNHARVLPEGGELYVEDLGSASGTLLNGSPVRRARLRAGDTITVGSSRLLVSLDAEGGQGVGPTDGLREAFLRDLEESRRGLTESQKEIAGLREELARARATLEAAEERALSSEKRSAEVGKKVRESADRRGKLLRELEEVRRREAEAAREAAEARASLRDLRADLARRDEELSALREERRKLEAARGEADAALRAVQERTRELTRSLEATEAGASELRQASEAASRDRESIRRELETVRSRLESTTVERESLRAERDLLRGELDRAVEGKARLEAFLGETRAAADAYRVDSLEKLAEGHRDLAALNLRLELAARDLEAERARGASIQEQIAAVREEADALRKVAEERGEESRAAARGAEILKVRVDAADAALAEERSRRASDRVEISALRETLLRREERSNDVAREVEALKLSLAASLEAVEREKEVSSRVREEASALQDRLAESEGRATGLREDILSLERHRLAVEAEREGQRRLLADLEAQREELEKELERRSEELRRALDLRDEEVRRALDLRGEEERRRRELEAEKASVDERLLHEVERTTRLEGEVSSLRSLVESERERFRGQREEDSRSHRTELEASLARGRSHLEELEREAGERIARFEARILELSAERDGLLARASAAELRAGELEAVLSRQRDALGERKRREEEGEARIAEISSARAALETERETLATRLGELEGVLGEREAELSRVREDIAWKNGELDRIRQALRDADREHTAEVVDLRAREGSISEDLASLRSDFDDLKARHEKALLEIESLRGERARSATEISLLRGYLEELKEKVREKDRQVLGGRDELRREAAEQTARLIQEKRRLESLVRDLREGRAGAPE